MDQEKMRKSLEMHFKTYKPPMKEGEEEKVEVMKEETIKENIPKEEDEW